MVIFAIKYKQLICKKKKINETIMQKWTENILRGPDVVKGCGEATMTHIDRQSLHPMRLMQNMSSKKINQSNRFWVTLEPSLTAYIQERRKAKPKYVGPPMTLSLISSMVVINITLWSCNLVAESSAQRIAVRMSFCEAGFSYCFHRSSAHSSNNLVLLSASHPAGLVLVV